MIARTLAQRIVIRTSQPTVFEAIKFLACDPEIVPAQETTLVLTAEPFRDSYRISEDGKDASEVIDLTALVEHLHYKVTSLSLLTKPHAGILHAALLRRRGRRVLISGRAGAGKTTLALRLVQAGYELEGDEHVFLEDDGVTARPRGCRVKETSLPFLPGAAKAIATAPVYVDHLGRKLFNVDPRMIGGTWRIEKGRAERIIVLQPHHGGNTTLHRLQPLALSQALISELAVREAGRRASIRAVARLASESKGYDLSLGNHDTAIKCIDRALED